MWTISDSIVRDDLRFALEVIEERSHLGLDSEYADKIKSVVKRRISDEVERKSIETAKAKESRPVTGGEVNF